MRFSLLIFAALLVAASPAAADVTLRYSGDEPMIVEALADGTGRISFGEDSVILTPDGVSWVIVHAEATPFAVRHDELALATAEWAHEQGLVADKPADQTFTIVEAGPEKVAGRIGTRFRLLPRVAAGERPKMPATDAILSADADLAPAGRVLARHLLATTDMTGMVAAPRAGLRQAFAALLEKGTVLRLSGLMKLESVDRAPIPRTHFALPARILDRAEFKAWLRRLGTAPPAR